MEGGMAKSDRAGRTAPGDKRYLVVTADDFGRSHSINRAVAAAWGRGVLTSASIVAGGDAFDEAAALAARTAGLSVGLHVTLSDGRSVLAQSAVPGLVDGDGFFRRTPFRAGVAYWRMRRSIAGQIGAEVKAQFDKIEAAGIRPAHVDCHHHLHMHPLLFDIIAGEAAARGVAWIRIPREPLGLLFSAHGRRLDARVFITWLVFRLLAGRCLRTAQRLGLSAADNVYGLSGTGKMDESYLLALLPYLRGATSEIYLHPDMASDRGLAEMEAVGSNRVAEKLKALGIAPVAFRELSEYQGGLAPAAEGVVPA
jgi:hopanoid biosynthesis associated protein HpnK